MNKTYNHNKNPERLDDHGATPSDAAGGGDIAITACLGEIFIDAESADLESVGLRFSPAAARHLADVLNRAADEAERMGWEGGSNHGQEESA